MSSAVVNCAVVLAAVTFVASGCNSGSPTEPQPQPVTPREVSGTITFANAGPENAPISSHSESGFVVQFQVRHLGRVDGLRQSGTLPCLLSPGGLAPQGKFKSRPAARSSPSSRLTCAPSVTPIPYAIVGTRAAVKEIDLADTLPATGAVGNTFGAFRTVMNPSTGRLVDTMILTLTNPALPGGGNPMGLDNIVLGR